MATLFAQHNTVLKYDLNVHMRLIVSEICAKIVFWLYPIFSPKGQMGTVLRRHLLAMDLSCDIYEKCRGAICRSLDIAIYICTYPKCRFDLSRSSEVKGQGQIWKADMVSY